MFKYPTFIVNHVKTLAPPRMLKSANCLTEQTRNTIVLKRKYPLPLHRKNRSPNTYRPRNFIYELVENTQDRKANPIKVILTEDVKSIGKRGAVLTVRAEAGYNKLLLPKKAVYASAENLEKYASEISMEKTMSCSENVLHAINKLSVLNLYVYMSKNVPWTLEKWHLRAHFRRIGFCVPEHTITMPEKKIRGPDASLERKQFYVTVTINDRDRVKVRCSIHHWSREEETAIPSHWDMLSIKLEPMFPEDVPVLESLPVWEDVRKCGADLIYRD